MLNYIWAGMIILSVLYGMATGRMEQVGNGAIIAGSTTADGFTAPYWLL